MLENSSVFHPLAKYPINHYFQYMKVVSFLKLGLFLYELLRTLYLVINLILQANNSLIFIQALFATQGVLFPLMALFLCLNTERYKEYLPLYIAGKSIGVFSILMWALISQGNYMIGKHIGEMSIAAFDLFSLVVILIIKRDIQKTDEIKLIQSKSDTIYEDSDDPKTEEK